MSKETMSQEEIGNMFGAVMSELFGPVGHIPVFDTFPLYRDKPMFENNLKFSFYGDISNPNKHQGIITIVTYVDVEQKVIHYGVAFCSPKDVYNKDVGKEIAYRNLVKDMNTVTLHKKQFHKINCRIFADLMAYGNHPSWAMKLIASNVIDHTLKGYF